MTRNQGVLLVSGAVAAISLVKEYRSQKAQYDTTMNLNRLFDDFMEWYDKQGKHLGINEFHREFKKNFEFVSVAKRAIN